MSLNVPKKFEKRFQELMDQAWALPDNLWPVFWEDLISTIEERLRVLQKGGIPNETKT